MADTDDLPETIPSLLIPMHGRPWLVPAAAVVEVVPLRQPDRPGRGADWMLGWLAWRDHDVPVLSFERLNESGQISIGMEARIAVLSAMSDHPPFYAVIIQGAPQPVEVTPEALIEEPVQTGIAEALCVQLGNELAVIPNFDVLEQAVGGLPQL